jgi:hypothetical protein
MASVSLMGGPTVSQAPIFAMVADQWAWRGGRYLVVFAPVTVISSPGLLSVSPLSREHLGGIYKMTEIVMGGTNNVNFPLQFPQPGMHRISAASTLIRLLSNDGEYSEVTHSSGSFWRHNGIVYLLTARHVVSGRHPFSDTLISATGYIPRHLMVYPTIMMAGDQWARVPVRITMNDEEGGWLQDPEFENLRTDIALVPMIADLAGPVFCLNDDLDFLADIYTTVGLECAVVGYPTSNFGGLMSPIWRTGNFASEPWFPIDNKPIFALDVLTSPGFSGAPVFRRHIGPLPVRKADGTIDIDLNKIVTNSFVGIYSGRIDHPIHLNGEVPFVFYANRIPYILGDTVMVTTSLHD